MIDRPVIRFENVSKRFNFAASQPTTVLESIVSLFSRNSKREDKTLWAVKKVTFDVLPGECVGIIGRNGSGKSTVLKLITGILRPTSGQVTVQGRLSALLELGAGFHHDLTGRENVFLNGSILGLSKEEMNRCYDSIVEFSNLGEFIDMPVKHYSTGMYMRLGFSIAVHVDPKVLLVDEILAVGDQPFQNKCIERINAMKRAGTTIIFVSHNIETIRTLCSRLIWLEHGIMKAAGPVSDVIGQYHEYLYKSAYPQLQTGPTEDGSFRRWGTGAIEITNVLLIDGDGNVKENFKTGDPLTIEIRYVAHESVSEPEFGLAIFRQDGVQVNGPNNRIAGLKVNKICGPGVVRYHIDSLPLLADLYRITVAIHNSQIPQAYDFHEQAYQFRVVVTGDRELDGLVEIPASWEWEQL